MRLQKFTVLIVSIFTFALQVLPCSADVIMYFGGPDQSKLDLSKPTSTVTPVRNSFLSSLGSFGIDDLESRSGANPTLVFGSSGITGTTGFSNGVQSLALYATSGSNFIYDGDGTSTPSTPNDFIQFSRAVTAFGTYITQSGDDVANDYSVLLENTVTGTSKLIPVTTLGPKAPFFNVVFFGITDTQPFNRISFIESYDTDGLLYDDLIAGDLAVAVPEPGSWAILAAGIAGIVRYQRRKRATA